MRISMLAVALAAALFPMPAKADDTARLANGLALEQLVDAVQTHAGLSKTDCASWRDPSSLNLESTCWHPFQEADPFARPFVHSLPAALLAGAALNLGARELGERVPASRFLLGAIVTLYPLVLAHNVRAMHVSFSFHP